METYVHGQTTTPPQVLRTNPQLVYQSTDLQDIGHALSQDHTASRDHAPSRDRQ